MASENRIFTHALQGEVSSTNLNDIQDNCGFAWEMPDSTLNPTNALEGNTLYYGQFPNLTPGGGPPAGLNVLDNSRDWRNRIVLMHVQHVTNANDLPKGGSYDPNDVASVNDWNLWYTGIFGIPELVPPRQIHHLELHGLQTMELTIDVSLRPKRQPPVYQ
jgi:hypothetical protein